MSLAFHGSQQGRDAPLVRHELLRQPRQGEAALPSVEGRGWQRPKVDVRAALFVADSIDKNQPIDIPARRDHKHGASHSTKALESIGVEPWSSAILLYM